MHELGFPPRAVEDAIVETMETLREHDLADGSRNGYRGRMTLKFEEIVIDCHDFRTLGHWWEAALGWMVVDEDDEVLELQNPDGSYPTLLFSNSPDAKVGKNRLHFDFVPDNQADEVERLLAMGAQRVDIGQGETPWVILADPEGNEFCVLTARS